ncbi:MAG TPA: 4Fe-4S dicluster domain-containing protein [Candidatus Aminicenantes bacterium]|nr:4Fe-4S dicluster domain-containing protein [Candidatus Aminicenantes bacterium]
MKRSIDEINRRITRGEARVVRADEMTRLVREEGVSAAAQAVDVVTTGTFGPMCSSGVMMNFGQAEPPIRMARVWINGVEAHAGLAAVDAYLGATQTGPDRGIHYGGAHVITDLVRGHSLRLQAESTGTDCYPRRHIDTIVRLSDLNHATLLNPRNAYQRYAAATNTSSRTLHTYMGTLLPGGKNVTWAGAGELSPLANDPAYRFIGAGTRIFLAGAIGMVTGAGTQHDPDSGMATVGVIGNLFRMTPEFLRPAVLRGYGCSLYVGVGIPIPILDEDAALCAAVDNASLQTEVLDFSQAGHPRVATVTYRDLHSGSLCLSGRSTACAPLSSPLLSRRVAENLADWIRAGRFLLSLPAEPLPLESRPRRLPLRDACATEPAQSSKGLHDTDKCVHCGQCVLLCPADVFSRHPDGRIQAMDDRCINCGECRDFCPAGALSPVTGGPQ